MIKLRWPSVSPSTAGANFLNGAAIAFLANGCLASIGTRGKSMDFNRCDRGRRHAAFACHHAPESRSGRLIVADWRQRLHFFRPYVGNFKPYC
ncbi:hypothetical protein ABIB57_003087 [Devosia sp. UYZn731]|uniref:hypothetical protein n=1 Tax=Devosia sp. UYZn731 TaxID=3156345 RepID=UPI0033926F54